MPWPFCSKCHFMLTLDGNGVVKCSACNYTTNIERIHASVPSITSMSSDKAIPIWARSNEEQEALKSSNNEEPHRATVLEPCLKCGHPEVAFYTVQLRSVDEGQTVFHECPNCKYTWSVHNWYIFRKKRRVFSVLCILEWDAMWSQKDKSFQEC